MDPSPITEPHRPRTCRAIVASVLVAAIVLASSLLAVVGPAGASSGLSAPGRDPLAVAGTRARQATVERERAEADLRRASTRRRDLESKAGALASADATSTMQLATARRQVRELAVAAYIDGGRTELLQATLEPDQAAAVSWRVGMVSGGVGQVSESVDRYERLLAVNEPARRSMAEQLDEARSEEADALSAVVQASAAERDAVAAAANAAASAKANRDRAAAATAAGSGATAATARDATVRPGATRTPTSKTAPKRPASSASGAAGLGIAPASGAASSDDAAFLARVRACESRGDYSALSPGGRYRGAYQFSVETWRGVGGSGDPAAASPAEQDARALALLRLQGRRAWPVCGR